MNEERPVRSFFLMTGVSSIDEGLYHRYELLQSPIIRLKAGRFFLSR